MSSATRRPLAGVLLAGVFLALALLAPVANAAPSDKSRPVKVMTRNLYLGADLTPAIAAQTPLALAQAGTQIWNTVQATDFPARAKLLAKEICRTPTRRSSGSRRPRSGAPARPTASPSSAVSPLPTWCRTTSRRCRPSSRRSARRTCSSRSSRRPTSRAPRHSAWTSASPSRTSSSRASRPSTTARSRGRTSRMPASTRTIRHVPALAAAAGRPRERREHAWLRRGRLRRQQARVPPRRHRTWRRSTRASGRSRPGSWASAGPASVGGKLVLIGDLNSDPNGTFPNNLAVNTLLGTFGFTDSWAQINPDRNGRASRPASASSSTTRTPAPSTAASTTC